MKKLIIFLTVTIVSIVASAQPSDAYILNMMKGEHLPGLEIAIIKDSKLVWYRNWGFANLSDSSHIKMNNVFLMASVSKTITETAIMQLWEKGKFKLDDDISHYLPFQVRNPNFPNDSITFRMLMAHVSSIKDNDTLTPLLLNTYLLTCPITLDSLMKNYFTPGKEYYSATHNFYGYAPAHRYNYSNEGVALLGYLVQCISGEPFDQYCQTHIFDSLCMQNTSWSALGISDTGSIVRPYSWNNPGYIDDGLFAWPDYPCGLLRTNITAMERFEYMYLHHGIYNGVRILDSATVDTILSLQFQNAIGTYGQGLIFYQTYMPNGDTMYGHAGGTGGASTEFQFNYNHHIGLLMFSNGDGYATLGVDTLWDTIYNYALSIAVQPTDTFPFTCGSLAGVNELPVNQTNSINVYPNPSNGIFNCDSRNKSNGLKTIEVYNIMGEKVQSFSVTGPQFVINLRNAPSGIYLCRMLDENGNKIKSGKIIKE